MADQVIKHSDSYIEVWEGNTHWMAIMFSPKAWGVARTTYHDPGTNATCSLFGEMQIYTSVAGAEPPIHFRV